SAYTSEITEDFDICAWAFIMYLSLSIEHEVLNLDLTWTRSCYRQENLQVYVSDKHTWMKVSLSLREYGYNNHGSSLISINTACDQVEFKRISLTGFRSCTSRSRYRSVSKQTTRHLPQSCLMLTLKGFPFITMNTKEYHSECSGNYHKDDA
ncbi:hypothetical protein Tco_1487358, partial [Tanacetum coccineum]